MITVTTTDNVSFELPETGDTNWDDVTPCIAHLTAALLQGAPVTTPQLALTPVTSSLADNSTLNPGNRTTYVIQGTSGPVTLNQVLPLGGGNKDGAILILIGASDTNTVTIPDNGGSAQINGPCTLTQMDMLQLIWIAQFSKWLEISRNN